MKKLLLFALSIVLLTSCEPTQVPQDSAVPKQLQSYIGLTKPEAKSKLEKMKLTTDTRFGRVGSSNIEYLFAKNSDSTEVYMVFINDNNKVQQASLVKKEIHRDPAMATMIKWSEENFTFGLNSLYAGTIRIIENSQELGSHKSFIETFKDNETFVMGAKETLDGTKEWASCELIVSGLYYCMTSFGDADYSKLDGSVLVSELNKQK